MGMLLGRCYSTYYGNIAAWFEVVILNTTYATLKHWLVTKLVVFMVERQYSLYTYSICFLDQQLISRPL